VDHGSGRTGSGAWAADTAYLYAGAYSIVSLRRRSGNDGIADRAAVLELFAMLPPSLFPISHAHGEELLSGQAHERFDFTLELLFGGIAPDRQRADPTKGTT
jgi:hypothetical protein